MLGQRKYHLWLTFVLTSLCVLPVDMLSMWKVEFCGRSIYCAQYNFNLFFVQVNAVVEAVISWSVRQRCIAYKCLSLPGMLLCITLG